MRRLLLFMLVATFSLPGLNISSDGSTLHAQSGETAYSPQDVYVAVNQSLIDADARPLGRSETLDMIAQQIADELSNTGAYEGAPRSIADELGYPRWPDNGQRVITEAINYIGIESPRAFANNRQQDIIETLQNTFYREMGVGVANYQAVAEGTVQNVYVIVMGAQPNVLPVVINDGADVVYTRDVELYIHSEFSLAYETDSDIIQQAVQIRVANSEAGLDDAQPIQWEGNNFGLAWQLTEGFGDKEVWVEFEDEKGVRVRSSSMVEYADPATAPTAAPTTSAATLTMTYGGDTFTLAVESEQATVRLQEVYFQWELDGFTRAYEIENPDGFQSVDLENFSSADCLQIRWVDVQVVVEVADCANIFLEAQRFTELQDVFWYSRVQTFAVYDGPQLLGNCEISAGNCDVSLP